MPLLSFREVLLSTFGFNYYWNAAIHAHFRSSFANYNIIRFKYRIIIQRMPYTQTHYKTTVSALSFLVFFQGKCFYSRICKNIAEYSKIAKYLQNICWKFEKTQTIRKYLLGIHDHLQPIKI